jgi:hypothetical protein
MKTARFWMGAATCVALSACTGLLTESALEGCYPVDALSERQKAALHVGRGNPIFLAGGERIVCACYRAGSLAGADEEGRLDGASEEGLLTGIGEKGQLAGVGEEGHLDGANEKSQLAGADEEGRLDGASEEGRLAGDFAELSCRIVPGCPGFQLIAYEPKQITILTATGQKSVPTSCVTW